MMEKSFIAQSPITPNAAPMNKPINEKATFSSDRYSSNLSVKFVGASSTVRLSGRGNLTGAVIAGSLFGCHWVESCDSPPNFGDNGIDALTVPWEDNFVGSNSIPVEEVKGVCNGMFISG
jgi:hypothetical protein